MLQLQTLVDTGRLDTSKPIDLAALCNTKLFKIVPTDCEYGFQLTDEGLDNFSAKVNIEVQWAPEQVIAAIEKNGGVITTAYYDPPSLLAIRDPMKFFARGFIHTKFYLNSDFLKKKIYYFRSTDSKASNATGRCGRILH